MKKITLLLAAAIFTLMTLLPTAFMEGKGRKVVTQPEKLIDFQKGNFPLILSSPHDGHWRYQGLSPRKNPKNLRNFNDLADMHTAEITRRVAREFEKLTGRKVFFVINRLHRKYMDPNRSPQKAYEDSRGKKVYKLYHGTLSQIRKYCHKKYGRGLIVDIHGQTKLPADVYLGTQKGRTLKDLIKRKGPQVYSGSHSLGALLARRGYRLPRFTKKMTYKTKRGETKTHRLPLFTPSSLGGGYIVRHHSSGKQSPLPAVQVEIHRRIRFDRKKRRQFARDLAWALALFSKKYLR